MRDISMHILDIMQNSAAAGADTITVSICVEGHDELLKITVEDNGCGMDEKTLAKACDPFFTTRTTRKIGLGIPLFKASAERAGGSFTITSGGSEQVIGNGNPARKNGAGTKVIAGYAIGNIDRPPIGDVAGVIADMAASRPEKEIRLLLENGSKQFIFSSRDIKLILGDVSLAEFEVLQWIKEYIGEGMKDIFGGVLSEIHS